MKTSNMCTLFKMRGFCYCELIYHEKKLQTNTDKLLIIKSTANNISRSTNIDNLERQ